MNVRVTFGERSGNIRGTFGERSEDVHIKTYINERLRQKLTKNKKYTFTLSEDTGYKIAEDFTKGLSLLLRRIPVTR